MLINVSIDDNLISDIEKISKGDKSDFIREAVKFYINHKKELDKKKLLKAISKTKEADLKENLELEGTLLDGI